MKPIPLLPLAPRPFEDELISSWQGRVAVRYALSLADIDAWLDLDSSASMDRDLQPDPVSLRKWALSCRIRTEAVEALALSRYTTPLGYVFRSQWRGICCICLEYDRGVGRDQYFRRSWARAEAVACPFHRVRLRYSCTQCITRCEFRFEYRNGLVELVCANCLGAVSRAPPTPSELRHADLLIATMEVINITERGALKLSQIDEAIRFLWSPSQGCRRSEITFFDAEHTYGSALMPANPDAPMTCLSTTWRAATLLAIAQILDIGSARAYFGPPGEWMTFAFQQFGSRPASGRNSPELPAAKPRKIEIPLRSDAEYLRLATATIKDPRWHGLLRLKARDRSKALSRLARDMLGTV
ncbi:TniQ family protein [Rhizobium sp. NFACC06-2]|uniref:TniQ family protein n=1 Tax=Rhizobium sp. NFACC06-2 TaxID=1566264 RepID=UPI000876C414|nr:TniQ family protein [Rhizobium sp. NFACC06-2]SCY85110.1 TniQ protein [Rhizobium sp. NFACC06-2]SCY89511.1 TniQ protein [Rhizobium sp. NFACC06-2]